MIPLSLQNPIAPGIEPIQVVSMIMILLIMVLLYLEYRESPTGARYCWAMGWWMIHGLIFYAVLFTARWTGIDLPFGFTYTAWSSILRLHGYITVAVIEYTRLRIQRIRKSGQTK